MNFHKESFDLSGLDEVQQGLARLAQFAESDVISNALKAEAEGHAEAAKAAAPEATGKLKRAIRARKGRSRKGGVSWLAAVGQKFFHGETFYGAFQEFGWKVGKRANSLQSQIRRTARQLRDEARRARKLGKGKGLARKGTEMRARQEGFIAEEAARRVKASGGVERRQIPGEHFMQYTFEERAEGAKDRILQKIKQGIETEAGKTGTTL